MKKLSGIVSFLFLAMSASFADSSSSSSAPNPSWQPNSMIVFGDGYSDNGNAYRANHSHFPESPPYWHGRYSNGPVWAEILASNAQFTGDPTTNPDQTNSKLFHDYARGDSVILKTDESQRKTTTLDQQIAQYSSEKSAHSATAVAIFWDGANDLMVSPCYQKPFLCVDGLVKDLKKNILTVYGTGVKHFVVISAPNVSLSPSIRKNNDPATQTDIADLVRYYNHNLALLAYQLGQQHKDADFLFIESQPIFDNIAEGYGLQTSAPCYDNEGSGTPCIKTDKGFFYWDNFYPTVNVHSEFASEISKRMYFDDQNDSDES